MEGRTYNESKVMFKRLVLIVLLLLAAVLLYLLLWPVPISPAAWTPAAAPALSGDYEKNSRLAGTQRLSLGAGFAPEDVAIDSENRIYAGLDDGRIMRLQADGTRPEVFANTQGRPLGMKFDSNGNLILADANKGLLSISRDGSITVLSTQADGVPFRCTNDLDIAADGTIYFTDASSKFPLSNYKADILEHQPNGRLLAYEPATKTTRVVLRDLHFANGVAISPDQTFVLVCRDRDVTGLHRVWLNGPKQGSQISSSTTCLAFPMGFPQTARTSFGWHWSRRATPLSTSYCRIPS